jgi:hypothetical protein
MYRAPLSSSVGMAALLSACGASVSVDENTIAVVDSVVVAKTTLVLDGSLKTIAYNDFPNLRWLGAVRAANPTFDAANIGPWHCVEARARLNDAGASDGVFQLWIDGELEAEKTGLNWVGSFDAYGINAVYLENNWNMGSAATQDRFMDNFVVSTERIGCG